MIIKADILDHVKPNSIGVELGVAEGKFTEQLILKNKLLHVYSIDSWDNLRCSIDPNVVHNEEEYKKTLTRLDIYKDRNSILRMTFESASTLFPDEYFDFVFIDGDPTTGENKGNTIEKWIPKVKKDGVIAGSNYHLDYPKLKEFLDNFVKQHKYTLHIHDFGDKDDLYSKYPCWFIKLDEVVVTSQTDSTEFEFPRTA